MKKNVKGRQKIIYLLLIISVLINLFIPNIVMADMDIGSDAGGASNGGGESVPITSATIPSGSGSSSGNGYPVDMEAYEPELNTEDSDKAMKIITNIFSMLQVIGVVAFVVALGIFGFNTIIGSVEEKAIAKEKCMGFMIGALLVTGGITLAKFLISIAEGL